jgi:hypothetical protein
MSGSVSISIQDLKRSVGGSSDEKSKTHPVRKEVTFFRTPLSTLCHEFCHHLDFSEIPVL